MIPLLTRAPLKLTQHQAHGTSLCAVTATGLAGACGYWEHVQWESAAAIAVTGMGTARLGALATAYLSGTTLRKALGVLMLVLAPAVPAKKYVVDKYARNEYDESACTSADEGTLWRLWKPASIGLASGFLAGLFGVGGGTIVVPALTIATDCTHYQALATSLAAMVLPALAGTVTHYGAGNVKLRVVPALVGGALLGGYVGGQYIGLRTNEDTLRYGFSGLLAVLGLRTIMKA